VNARRSTLCAILIYVALDLSLPMMPGAFVFEADASVESVQGSRGRAGVDVAVAAPPALDRLTPALPGAAVVRPTRLRQARPPVTCAFLQCRPRAMLAATAVVLEDPH
jgi:hypothetical protein